MTMAGDKIWEDVYLRSVSACVCVCVHMHVYMHVCVCICVSVYVRSVGWWASRGLGGDGHNNGETVLWCEIRYLALYNSGLCVWRHAVAITGEQS